MIRSIFGYGILGIVSANGTAIAVKLSESNQLAASRLDTTEQWMRIAAILIGSILVPGITLLLAWKAKGAIARRVASEQPCGGNIRNCPYVKNTERGD